MHHVTNMAAAVTFVLLQKMRLFASCEEQKVSKKYCCSLSCT